MRFRRVLTLSPHTDDTEIGCGGTVARLAEEGAEIFTAVFSIAEASLPPDLPHDTLLHECREALPRLGVRPENIVIHTLPVRRLADHRQAILEELVRLRREIDPDLIMLPSATDVHQDHQTVSNEGVRAFKERTILGYELPWNQLHAAHQAFVGLERRHIGQKWEALQAYRSQLRLRRSYFDADFVESLARVRGTQVKREFAESFEVIRICW